MAYDNKCGVKHDEGKVQLHYLPFNAISLIAKVFMFGANKYDDWNWCKGMPYSRLFNACQRHLWAWFNGEDNDPESKLSHLGHAGCCVLMLIWMSLCRPDLDDRPRYGELTLEGLEDSDDYYKVGGSE